MSLSLSSCSSSSSPSAPLGGGDGALELSFLEALLCGDWRCAASAVARVPTGPRTHQPLPGSTEPPTTADIDAFAFRLPLLDFARHFPDVFSITLGGKSIPSSSADLCATRELRFVGTSNSSIYVHVPADEYAPLFGYLPPSAPSIHELQASATARQTITITAFKEAMAQAGVTEVVVTCYGLKDQIRLSFPSGLSGPPSVSIAEHSKWVSACIARSRGSRLDVGVVWVHGHRAPLFSRPGGSGQTGIRMFAQHPPQQAVGKLMRYLYAHPGDPLATGLPEGGWAAGNFHVPAAFLRRPASAASLRGATVSPAPAGAFYDRDCLLHPHSLASGAGTGRSGVASVSLYNNDVKHAAVAAEPERGYNKFGWGEASDGTRAPRKWIRELDSLLAAAALTRSFRVGQYGGIRAEAKVVIEGSDYTFDRALTDGVKAALFVGSSAGSGIFLDASVEKAVADGLVDVVLRLANSRRGRPDLGLYVQGVVSQLGYYVLKAARSRDFFHSGAAFAHLLRPWHAAAQLGVPLGGGSPGRGGSGGGGGGGGGVTTPPAPSSAEVTGLIRQLPASARSEAAASVASLSSSAEALRNAAARRRYKHHSAVSALEWSTAMGPGHAAYSASVAVPTSSARPLSRVLAVGTFAEASFAFELHQAFLALANERAVRIPEARVRTLGFRGKEGAKPFRICVAHGIDVECSDGAPSAEARAIATSHVPSILVWCHFEEMNRITAAQRDAIPLKKAGVTSQVKGDYIRRGTEAARAYFSFRAAVVEFIRTRHILRQNARGVPIAEEFSSRPASSRRDQPTARPLQSPPQAPLAPGAPPSPLTGDLARRMRARLVLLGGPAENSITDATSAASPLDTPQAAWPPSPLTGDLARRMRARLELAGSPGTSPAVTLATPTPAPVATLLRLPRVVAAMRMSGGSRGGSSEEESISSDSTQGTNSSGSNGSWIHETDEPRYAHV